MPHISIMFFHTREKKNRVSGAAARQRLFLQALTSVDFILDGEHVDPIAVKMALV